ncbi:MAG TPA: FlgD immunoglobulin-like domain containing protein, partial [Candidatus Edwardsbacteria bacterium]|nr:FlgD immunoglobulin-like domain containing protein [Candidatus Edwardsbacteria bacterium]
VFTDSLTGVPLNRVQVDVGGIGKSVYTDTLAGDYHRMLMTGTYALTFSKTGYRSKTINNVYAKLDSVTTLDVQLAPLTGVVSQPAERPLPIRTDLFYGRPNPLRDRTVIGYQLQRPGPASLRLYNAAGQLVRTLDQGQHGAGYHAVTWDGKDDHGAAVAAGVYVYRLDAGALTRTNKLVVVR